MAALRPNRHFESQFGRSARRPTPPETGDAQRPLPLPFGADVFRQSGTPAPKVGEQLTPFPHQPPTPHSESPVWRKSLQPTPPNPTQPTPPPETSPACRPCPLFGAAVFRQSETPAPKVGDQLTPFPHQPPTPHSESPVWRKSLQPTPAQPNPTDPAPGDQPRLPTVPPLRCRSFSPIRDARTQGWRPAHALPTPAANPAFRQPGLAKSPQPNPTQPDPAPGDQPRLPAVPPLRCCSFRQPRRPDPPTANHQPPQNDCNPTAASNPSAAASGDPGGAV